jgi:hypothetical protein
LGGRVLGDAGASAAVGGLSAGGAAEALGAADFWVVEHADHVGDDVAAAALAGQPEPLVAVEVRR